MIAALSLGVIGVLGSALALHQHLAARRSLAALDEVSAALQQAQQDHQDLDQRRRAELVARDAAARATLEAVQTDLLALIQSRDACNVALERTRQQVAGLKRALTESSGEQDRLGQLLEETQLRAARAEEALAAQRALQTRLDEAERELARLRAEGARTPSRTFFARMAELDTRADGLTREVETWARRAQTAEAELARREASGAHDEVIVERDALRARVDALEELATRSASTRAALRALGLPTSPRDARLLSQERRGATESVLRDTALAASAAACALLDARGVAWARLGTAGIAERLAASAAILADAPVAQALGRPAQLTSELYGVYGRHTIALPGTDLVLGLTASRVTPTLQLRLAALQLVGLAPLPSPPSAEVVSLALDPALSSRLDAWAVRRDAAAVAVLGGTQPAATDSDFAGGCVGLLSPVRALYSRAVRDGFSQGFAVIWRAADDVTLAARVLDDGHTVAFARFNAPPAQRTLDDLVATVRWIGAPLAAAS